MTHRELLLWLKPQLERAATTGLSREDLRAIRAQLEKVRETSPLQPFASKLHGLVSSHTLLDVQTVAALAAEVRVELAPPRERTIVWSATDEDEEARDKSNP
jgi:hypothetical protein